MLLPISHFLFFPPSTLIWFLFLPFCPNYLWVTDNFHISRSNSLVLCYLTSEALDTDHFFLIELLFSWSISQDWLTARRNNHKTSGLFNTITVYFLLIALSMATIKGKRTGRICGRFLGARLGIAYVTFTHILCAILLVLPGCRGAKMRSVAEHLLPRNSSPLWKASMSLWRATNCLGHEERARQVPGPVCPQIWKAGLSIVSSPIPSLLWQWTSLSQVTLLHP